MDDTFESYFNDIHFVNNEYLKVIEKMNLLYKSYNNDNFVNLITETYNVFNAFKAVCLFMKFSNSNSQIRNLYITIYNNLKDHLLKLKTNINFYNKIKSIMNSNNYDNVTQLFLNETSKDYISTEEYIIHKKISDHKTNFNNNINKIIELRFDLAKIAKCEDYVNYINNNVNVLSISTIIASIVQKTESSSFDEIYIIHQKLKKKISLNDVFEYQYNLNNKIKLNTNTTINKFITLISNLFSIEFKQNTNKFLWQSNVILYSIYYENSIVGYIYFDIYKKNKLIDKPLLITLSKAAQLSDRFLVPTMIMMANFQNTITFIDLVNFAREFGNSILNIFHVSTHPFANITKQMKPFIAEFFTCIVSDMQLMSDVYGDSTDDIELVCNVVRSTFIKYKAFEALFDLHIHSHKPTNLLKTYNDLLSHCFKKAFPILKPYDKLPLCTVDNLYYNGGLVYSLVLCEVAANNVYNIVRKHDLFDDFISDILCETQKPFDKVINEFILNNKKTNIKMKNKFEEEDDDPYMKINDLSEIVHC